MISKTIVNDGTAMAATGAELSLRGWLWRDKSMGGHIHANSTRRGAMPWGPALKSSILSHYSCLSTHTWML